MNLATFIAIIALAAVVFLAVRYLVKEKKKGSKCVGCPYAASCMKGDMYEEFKEFQKNSQCNCSEKLS